MISALPTVAQTSESVGQSVYRQIGTLSLREKPLVSDASPVVPPTSPSSAVAPVSEASFAIHREKTILLLHLKNKRNRVRLRITNAVGHTTETVSWENMTGGFYELPILEESAPSGVYTISLAVNEQVLTFQATR